MFKCICVDEKEAAKILNLAVQTLRNWRLMRRCPRYVKFGRAARYRLEYLQEFIDNHTINFLPRNSRGNGKV